MIVLWIVAALFALAVISRWQNQHLARTERRRLERRFAGNGEET